MYNEKYMKLAIEIAEQGRGKCSPNPFVGAIIVKDDEIVGQGFTQVCGHDHAEVQALKQAKDKAKDAEMYVTLEPCAHYGKTPPCAKAIIEAGIKAVYAGIQDPNPKVNGKGFEMLKQANIHIESNFFKDNITRQLEYYLKWIQIQKPFIIMKNAVSLDGKIAADNGNSKWITNEKSRQQVHHLRQEVDAVITTINTVKQDNPMLNVRLQNVFKQPIRVILDPILEIDIHCNICKTANDIPTLIFYDKSLQDKSKLTLLNQTGIQSIPANTIIANNKIYLDMDDVLLKLGALKICSVMVESGNKLNSYLLKNKLVDKLYYFIAPKILGGNFNVYDSLNISNMDDKIELSDISIKTFDDNILVSGYPVYSDYT